MWSKDRPLIQNTTEDSLLYQFKLLAMPNKTANFITIVSALGMAFFISYAVILVYAAIRISIDTGDFLYELFTLVFVLPLVIPAWLGLSFYRRRPAQWTKTVFTYYLLYLLALILAAVVLLVPTDDPLAAGLPMVLFVLPASVILSLLLGIRWWGARGAAD